MHINRLFLQNFRNHEETVIESAPHVNVITGPNGAGKTNIIDAIHYLCMSRSFISSSDRYVVAEGESYFTVEGAFEGNIRSSFEVGCRYSGSVGKKIFVNESPLDRFTELIGMVPVVVLSPEDRRLTADGPAERRGFIDGFISQISSTYLNDLVRYNRIRKQRNRILQESNGSRQMTESLLEPWTLQLIEVGSRIVRRRAAVLDRFRVYLDDQYQKLAGMVLKPDLTYRTFFDPEQFEGTIEEAFRMELEKTFERELEREQTVTGPHRDEIVFHLGEMELRNYGSQGEHRLFTIALKLAQLFYYSDELEDLPLMLMDDVFGNLDPEKTQIVLRTLQEHPGQTFITSASEEPFHSMEWDESGNNAWFRVMDGNVERVE
ncbi:MAG: DNA replication/repair protein RecF [Balneolaceae bacterium]